MTKEELRRQAAKRRRVRAKAAKATVLSSFVIAVSLSAIIALKG